MLYFSSERAMLTVETGKYRKRNQTPWILVLGCGSKLTILGLNVFLINCLYVSSLLQFRCTQDLWKSVAFILPFVSLICSSYWFQKVFSSDFHLAFDYEILWAIQVQFNQTKECCSQHDQLTQGKSYCSYLNSSTWGHNTLVQDVARNACFQPVSTCVTDCNAALGADCLAAQWKLETSCNRGHFMRQELAG